VRSVTTALAVLALGLAPGALAKAPPKPAQETPSLTALRVFFHVEPAQRRDRSHSCAKGATQSKARIARSSATGDLARKAVVACEQPPRSQLVLPGLQHAAAVVRALVG
jgi:hypothetical protein